MKRQKPFPTATALTDKLGARRVVGFGATMLLCTPAPGSPVPVSLPTATTLPWEACHFDDHEQCVGSCAADGQCSAVVSGGACECRTACDCVGIR